MSALTKASLDAAVSILEADPGAAGLVMDRRGFWLVVDEWSMEFMCADRRKRRRMLRRRAKGRS